MWLDYRQIESLQVSLSVQKIDSLFSRLDKSPAMNDAL